MAGSEALLAAVSCCLVLQCCRSCKKAKSGTRSSEDPRAAAKVRSTNHDIGRAGTATAKTVVFIRPSVSRALQSSGVEHSSESRTLPSHKAASPQEELLPEVKWLGKAVEIMQLGQNAVDEVKAEDGALAGQLHERRVRAAWNSSKGN
eukprot:486956-Pleurochrysis_carterae.AAC.2